MAAGGGSATIVRVGALVAPDGVGLEIGGGSATTTVRLVARTGLAGIASGRFSHPSAAVPIHVDGEPTHLGFSYTQFAMPVTAGPALDFDFRPAPNLRSPPVLGVLIARTAGAFVLLAPLDRPHEQVSPSSTAVSGGAGTATSKRCRPGSRPRWACSAVRRSTRC